MRIKLILAALVLTGLALPCTALAAGSPPDGGGGVEPVIVMPALVPVENVSCQFVADGSQGQGPAFGAITATATAVPTLGSVVLTATFTAGPGGLSVDKTLFNLGDPLGGEQTVVVTPTSVGAVWTIPFGDHASGNATLTIYRALLTTWQVSWSTSSTSP